MPTPRKKYPTKKIDIAFNQNARVKKVLPRKKVQKKLKQPSTNPRYVPTVVPPRARPPTRPYNSQRAPKAYVSATGGNRDTNQFMNLTAHRPGLRGRAGYFSSRPTTTELGFPGSKNLATQGMRSKRGYAKKWTIANPKGPF